MIWPHVYGSWNANIFMSTKPSNVDLQDDYIMPERRYLISGRSINEKFAGR